MAKFHKRSIKIMFSLLFVVLLIVTLMLVFKKDTWPPEDLSSNTPESLFGDSEENSGSIELIFTLNFDKGQLTPSIGVTNTTSIILDNTDNQNINLNTVLLSNENSSDVTPQSIINEYFLY